MSNVFKAVIGLSALAFRIAVGLSYTDSSLLRVWPEAFSRASNNLALLAIAGLLRRDRAKTAA